MGKTVAVVGSREFPNMGLVEQYIDQLSENVTVMSGGHPFNVREGAATGVDLAALRRAWQRGLDILCAPPNWRAHGMGAGYRRNGSLARGADEVVAFWDGASRGTADTIRKATLAGKPITILKYTHGGKKTREDYNGGATTI